MNETPERAHGPIHGPGPDETLAALGAPQPERHPDAPGARLADDAPYGPLPGAVTLWGTVESTLRAPGRLAYEVAEGRSAAVCARLLAVVLCCLLGYGLLMGSCTGGAQLAYAPLKLACGTLLSALLCLPSLYIFACLSGARQSVPQAGGLVLVFLGLQGILLVGFAPIVWVFAQSTDSLAFMGGLHLAFWGISTLFGLQLLRRLFSLLNGFPVGVLRLWSVLFVVVALQMSTALRPLLGQSDRLLPSEKRFFLSHWAACLRGEGAPAPGGGPSRWP